jgi:5-methylcytosine-specific restriction endonuclease McrA
MATDITNDCQDIHNSTYKMLYNRLKPKVSRIPKTSVDYNNYKKCIRVMKVHDKHLLPISYCSYRKTLGNKRKANIYTLEGREYKSKDTSFTNKGLLKSLLENPISGKSVEYNDNKISLFTVQCGKCAITGQEFLSTDEIHCHHKVPISMGGKDNCKNLILVLPEIHKLIHAKREKTIQKYLNILNLSNNQIDKVNKLRNKIGLENI